MMIPQEYGGDETDTPDELVYKKLVHIQRTIAMTYRHQAELEAKGKSDPLYAEHKDFLKFVLNRHWREKLETLKDIGCRFTNCSCAYCVRVVGMPNGGLNS